MSIHYRLPLKPANRTHDTVAQTIKFGENVIIHNGKLSENYDETNIKHYMKNENIDIVVDIFTGSKNFTVYTMDLTNDYIKINSDYRS